jgi:superfamily II DNA or RNA helicase
VTFDFNSLIQSGSLIDNRRKQNGKTVFLKDVLNSISQDTESFKGAIGYMYIEGLALIIDNLRSLKEIKILMGAQTSKLTKQELLKSFDTSFKSLEKTPQTISAVVLFHSLIKESKTLEILAYFGTGEKIERLHSKAYLFLRNMTSKDILNRYKAGVVGSSNLTPSGLIGNTELNVVLTDPKDLQYLETWFDELWLEGSNEFGKLQVADAIAKSIEKSKFGPNLKETFVYASPEEFFKILIKYMNANYLFDDWSESKLLAFQQVDTMRCLRLFYEKNRRGVFLTSSVGLGKSYVASQTAMHFVRNRKKVLLIAPSGLIENDDQWPRYVSEFNLKGKIDLLGMGMLSKDPQRFDSIDIKKYEKDYSLIIIDEAHNYRNEDSFRARNLKKIIDKNGDSKLLFLTATPINTSLDDLVNLIRLFYRPGHDMDFDRLFRLLVSIVETIHNTPYETLTKTQKKDLIDIQEEIEKEFFVKSTRTTIKTSPDYLKELETLTNTDLSKILDPHVEEVSYSLDDKYKKIVNGIVDFIAELRNAHLRVLDPEKGNRLGPFFKWILYKRFESDISSYYLTLRRILKKNNMVLRVIETKNIKFLELDETLESWDDTYDDIEVKFDKEFKLKLLNVIEKIKSGKGQQHLDVFNDLKHDIKLITEQIKNMEFFLQNSENILFNDDKKLSTLLDQIRKNKSKKVLIFTEYTDTLLTLKQYLAHRFPKNQIAFVDSKTGNKQQIINNFNKSQSELKILISTDTLSEGFNISGADVVVNFDIPYNPVRLIQRIGRATRLDVPKDITVLNFRPDDDIDKEIILVERLKFRIEDIIRFIGLEYRIWFEREEELLKERRELDVKVYRETANQVLKGYREDMWKGNFDKLEVNIPYSNPVLILLQKAIQRYGITNDDVENKKIEHNTYTLLKKSKDLVIFDGDLSTFNEKALDTSFDTIDKQIVFEKTFSTELNNFKKYLNSKKQKESVYFYYNDKIDKQILSILDKIYSENMDEYIPKIKDLKQELLNAKEKCGDRTSRIVRDLFKQIKLKMTKKDVDEFIIKLQDSYTKKSTQTKLENKSKPLLAIGFLEDSTN